MSGIFEVDIEGKGVGSNRPLNLSWRRSVSSSNSDPSFDTGLLRQMFGGHLLHSTQVCESPIRRTAIFSVRSPSGWVIPSLTEQAKGGVEPLFGIALAMDRARGAGRSGEQKG
jgi:hypothetical protein